MRFAVFGWLLLVTLLLSGAFYPTPPRISERPELGRFFTARKLQGSFLLFDAQRNAFVAYNYARCQQGFLPASTFKILNTLIGLQTGVLQDEHSIMHPGDTQRANPAWNHDQPVQEAFRVSCVPCYQDLARRIGVERMREWTTKAGYGHLDIQPTTLDHFWLRGNSRISPVEQVEFLRRVHAGRVPFDKRHLATLKRVMLLDEQPGYRLYAKTGLASQPAVGVGWFVGYVERGSRTYFFATDLERPEPQPDDFLAARRQITEAILHELGVKP